MAQALRPFPQYTYIDTYAGQGDHSGHSTYHALIVEVSASAVATGLTIAGVVRVLEDPDGFRYGVGHAGYAADSSIAGWRNRSASSTSRTTSSSPACYDLPFGKGQRWLNKGPAAWVLGNWRISSINVYDSGTPVAVGTSLTLPIYASGAGGRVPAYVTSYNGWQPNWNGGFDPGKDNFFVPYGSGPFPTQGSGTAFNSIGNETRYNPKVRLFPNLNENISVTKSVSDSRRMHSGVPGGGVQRLQPRPLRDRLHAVAEPVVRRADRLGKPDQLAAAIAVGGEAVFLTEDDGRWLRPPAPLSKPFPKYTRIPRQPTPLRSRLGSEPRASASEILPGRRISETYRPQAKFVRVCGGWLHFLPVA